MRVLIVDDHEAVRRGVRTLLEAHCEVCGEAVNGRDALEKARQLRPDVIVMDVSMHDLNGLEAIPLIRSVLADSEILILSQHESPQMVQAAFKAGARGYVVKSSLARDLVAAFEAVSRHEFFFDPAIPKMPGPTAHIDTQEILQRSAALEQALRDSEEQFRLTFEHVGVGMAQVAKNGRFLRVNQRLCQILGYSQEELLNLKFQDVTRPTDVSADAAQAAQVAAGDLSSYSVEKRYIGKDGRVVWANLTVAAVHDAKQNLRYFIFAIEDISARKYAENALLESEERLRLAQEVAHVGTFEWNIKSGVNTWSPEMERMYGLPPGGFAGTKPAWEQMVHPHDRDETLRRVEQAMKEGTFEGEWRVVWPDGSVHWILGRASVLKDRAGNPEYLVGVNIDVTERKKMETTLRERERAFREMIDALPAPIYTTDAEGHLTHFNPAAVEFSGRTPELGTDRWCVSWKMFRADGSPLPHDQCPMAISLSEGRAVDGVEAIAERPNGTRVWFTPYPRPLHDAQGRIVGGINMLLDITERKQAERANSLLAAIVSSSDDAIVSKTLDGIITSWNKGAERVFGFTAEEAVGQGVTLIIPPDRRDEETEILNRLRRGERLDHFETVRQCKDGTLLDISVTISPVMDATGRVIGASKVARDITERKRAERALSEQARLLDLSNDAIIVRDAADRITYWNKAATELYGYTSEEALGCVTHKLLQTEFPAPLENINEQLHRNERWSGELGHIRKDGTKVIVVSRWVLDQKTYGNAWCVLETNNDITQQKWAEKRLRESEERYRKLSETLDAEVRARTKELEERNVDVLRQSQEVRDLSWRLLHMQDEERRHIARELHDSAGQLIAALQMNLIPLEPEAQKVSPDFADSIKVSLDLVGQLSRELRTVSHLLHPPLLDEAGLGSAIRWFVEGFGERSHIDVQLELSPDLGRLSREMEITVFRIIQECLTNIHRHANCDQATIRVSRSVEQVLLAVQDNGNGKGNKGSKNGGNGSKIVREGVGIQGMRQRVKQLGGSFEIRFAESGTRVTAVFPLQVPKGQDAHSAPESHNTVAPV